MSESRRSSSWQRPRLVSFDSADEYFRRSHRSYSLGGRSDDSSASHNRTRKVSMPAVPTAGRLSGTSYFSLKKRGEEKHENAPKMENTYRLEPKTCFPEGKIRQLMTDTLSGQLKSHSYDPVDSPFQAQLLSSRLMDAVKLLKIGRYKIVCLVSIGSKASQGLEMVSRCLWNADHDTFVNVTFEGSEFFAVATVYGVYFE